MRIAHVCSVAEEVSFESDGAEGRGVAFLSTGLVRAGHDVTLFASADSQTPAMLVPTIQRALRHHPSPKRHLAEGLTFLSLEKAFASNPPFDVVHVHAGFVAFPLMRRSQVPIVATVYGSLESPEVLAVYRQFREVTLIATSVEQVRQCPELNWAAVIPWNFPYQELCRLVGKSAALDETAAAYQAVYEDLVPLAAARRRAIRPSRPRHDAAYAVELQQEAG